LELHAHWDFFESNESHFNLRDSLNLCLIGLATKFQTTKCSLLHGPKRQQPQPMSKPEEVHGEQPYSKRGLANASIKSLPIDALAIIFRHCPDLDTLLNLASADPVLRRAIYHGNILTCDCCDSPLFSNEDLSEAAPDTKVFSCSVCHAKLCGYTKYDYDKRRCKPQVCQGCGKIECIRCMEAHSTDEDADGYGTENYCEDCQAEFEYGMGGC